MTETHKSKHTELHKEESVAFSIHEIRISDLKLEPRVKELKQPIKRGGIEFNFQINFLTFKNDKLLGISIDTNLSEKGQSANIPLGFLQLFISFHISKFDDVVVQKDGKETIPNTLIASLVSVSLGTLRGVIAAKVNETVLSTAIIPPMDPMKFLKDL